MAYNLFYSSSADKNLEKLDRRAVALILKWLDKNIQGCVNPRAQGKALKGSLRQYWGYRVGNYRIVCHIDDCRLTVLAIRKGIRKNVYK